MADPTADPQALALAHVDATGDGYRRTSRWLLDEHGLEVPAQTIGDWVRARRSGAPVKPNARTRTHAREVAEAKPPAEPDTDAFDPATATRRQFLEHELRVAVRRADTSRNDGVARQWAETAASRRADLDELERKEREEAEWKRKAEVVDPVELARRTAALAPALARVLPRDEFDNLCAALHAARPRE